jgi:hypothetical protein
VKCVNSEAFESAEEVAPARLWFRRLITARLASESSLPPVSFSFSLFMRRQSLQLDFHRSLRLCKPIRLLGFFNPEFRIYILGWICTTLVQIFLSFNHIVTLFFLLDLFLILTL